MGFAVSYLVRMIPVSEKTRLPRCWLLVFVYLVLLYMVRMLPLMRMYLLRRARAWILMASVCVEPARAVHIAGMYVSGMT